MRRGEHRNRGVAAGIGRKPAEWLPSRVLTPPGFPVTFAAEVKNFDPLQFVEKKEARKMGRFIHYAFAAAQEAMAQSGLKITEDIADRIGVFIGSGIGGFESSSASTPTC